MLHVLSNKSVSHSEHSAPDNDCCAEWSELGSLVYSYSDESGNNEDCNDCDGDEEDNFANSSNNEIALQKYAGIRSQINLQLTKSS